MFELLLYKTWTTKTSLMPLSFSTELKKTNKQTNKKQCSTSGASFEKERRRHTLLTYDQRKWFALKSNSQAGWNKYKCNNSFQQQPLHILDIMKWRMNGTEPIKIFKTLLISCVLGKYDVCNSSFSYSAVAMKPLNLTFHFWIIHFYF